MGKAVREHSRSELRGIDPAHDTRTGERCAAAAASCAAEHVKGTDHACNRSIGVDVRLPLCG